MPELSRVAVILAGGSGERFWPLSTPDRPKQLLKLSGSDKTLLEEAIDRAAPIFTRENIYIVTGSRIGPAIIESGLLPSDQVLIEPEPKNTLGALCWAVSQLEQRGYPDSSSMAVLTADHAIGEGFEQSVCEALHLAEHTQGLVTIGIQPTRPETGYGYIEIGDPVEAGFTVKRFAEKPSLELAEEYLRTGGYTWNSGMFFWTIGAFLSELHRHVPGPAAILKQLNSRPELFADLPRVAIDKALMERSANIFVVPAKFPWDDVGSWDSLARTSGIDEKGNVLIGPTAELDSTDCIVYSEEIPVGVLGLKDVIVVVTSTGVLVCDKSEAQRVREIAAKVNAGAGKP